MSDFTVRTASWRNDVSEIKRVRETVFVDEQAVPAELEWDGLDEICIHAIAEDSNRDAIGTGRLHPSGKSDAWQLLPIGVVAVSARRFCRH